MGGKVSFLDALPPNVEAGKLRLWDVNQLTLWEVNVFSVGLQRFRNRGCSEGTLKRNGTSFQTPLDQRINDEQKLSYASFLPLKK